jgi:hypothetical protein
MLMQYQHSHLCSYRLRNVRTGYVLYRALVKNVALWYQLARSAHSASI